MFNPKDRSVEFPNRYELNKVPGTDNIVDLIPAPGIIDEEGDFWNRRAAQLLQADRRRYIAGMDLKVGDVVDVQEDGTVKKFAYYDNNISPKIYKTEKFTSSANGLKLKAICKQHNSENSFVVAFSDSVENAADKICVGIYTIPENESEKGKLSNITVVATSRGASYSYRIGSTDIKPISDGKYVLASTEYSSTTKYSHIWTIGHDMQVINSYSGPYDSTHSNVQVVAAIVDEFEESLSGKIAVLLHRGLYLFDPDTGTAVSWGSTNAIYNNKLIYLGRLKSYTIQAFISHDIGGDNKYYIYYYNYSQKNLEVVRGAFNTTCYSINYLFSIKKIIAHVGDEIRFYSVPVTTTSLGSPEIASHSDSTLNSSFTKSAVFLDSGESLDQIKASIVYYREGNIPVIATFDCIKKMFSPLMWINLNTHFFVCNKHLYFFDAEQYCKVFYNYENNSISGKITNGATNAIVLTDAKKGNEIETIFSGSAEINGIVKGSVIQSAGVYGVSPIDGILSVYAKERPISSTMGEYVGTGLDGENNKIVLNFEFNPKLVIVSSAEIYSTDYYGEQLILIFGVPAAVYTGNVSSHQKVYCSWPSCKVMFYAKGSAQYMMNRLGTTYKYIAFK